jgi:hypothetical protein
MPDPARALAERLRSLGVEVDEAGYVADFEQALLEELSPEARTEIRRSLEGKGGSELIPRDGAPPKFYAAHSSACLAANAFGPFLGHRTRLLFGPREIEGMAQLERECPTGLRGTPPTLDLLVEGDDVVLAVESKCIEPFGPHPARFSDSYDALVGRMGAGWRAEYEALRSDELRFRFLDAAQLVKHYLGLRNTFPQHRVILVYLYWTPTNASALSVCRIHREEATSFAGRVSDHRVSLVPMTYSDLWRRWQEAGGQLSRHAALLKQRYEVDVLPT